MTRKTKCKECGASHWASTEAALATIKREVAAERARCAKVARDFWISDDIDVSKRYAGLIAAAIERGEGEAPTGYTSTRPHPLTKMTPRDDEGEA